MLAIAGTGQGPLTAVAPGAKIWVVAYYLTFFCRSGEENGSSALASLLSELTQTGDPVLIKRAAADYAGEVDGCELATDNGSGMPPANWLVLELSAGVEYNAESVISASPDDECGIWGSDLRAELILTGNTDWPLVYRIWAVLVTLWSAIAWDELSGFEANKDAPEPAAAVTRRQPGRPRTLPGLPPQGSSRTASAGQPENMSAPQLRHLPIPRRPAALTNRESAAT